MLSREIALYKRLQELGVEVTFVTYGGKEDLKYSGIIPGLHICCNRWGLKRSIYDKLIPMLFWFRIGRASIIKTNQMNGAEYAVRAAKIFRKPLVARCGYMWSKNVGIESGEESSEAQHALAIEERVFRSAQRIVVTSEEMARSVLNRFPNYSSKLGVVRNYVDTDMFYPASLNSKSTNRLCYVGRLAPEKNLLALLEAISGLAVELDLIGDGPMREDLERMSAGMQNVRFHGRVRNHDLPGYLRNATAFVFPSLYEGHPKTPLEAMACGLPVVATNVSGVREIIDHDKTGWLCSEDSTSIREGIEKVLSDPVLQRRLGEAGRNYVVENCSLNMIVNKELQMYQSILNGVHTKRNYPA